MQDCEWWVAKEETYSFERESLSVQKAVMSLCFSAIKLIEWWTAAYVAHYIVYTIKF